jgi:hypothetical protein
MVEIQDASKFKFVFMYCIYFDLLLFYYSAKSHTRLHNKNVVGLHYFHIRNCMQLDYINVPRWSHGNMPICVTRYATMKVSRLPLLVVVTHTDQ